ncbi:hypothetical protein CVD28_14235 [Bacillus sp. M6-12]|uniref:c-type cytochrome n=1 Tax=Bacillus sp. M6-12 TaxID=2054166 RepID=UPI000C7570E4|nr:cytochrome c [Bacillus sp. M6-12]PLS16993.1 hypothetical protein CVD28_14235 [Bacillus sp. M6-12]
MREIVWLVMAEKVLMVTMAPISELSQVAKDDEDLKNKIKQGGTLMPAFEKVLTEEQIKNVAAYLTEVVVKSSNNSATNSQNLWERANYNIKKQKS